MPVCSLLVCVFLNVFFCTVNEGKNEALGINIDPAFVCCFKRHLHNLLTCCCVCLLLSVGWFTVGVVALCVPAALGYLQDRCGGRASEDELQKRHYHAVHRRDLQTIHLTKQEAMLEVRDL